MSHLALVPDDPEPWLEWFDPDRPDKNFRPGDVVVVLTDEGALRRGRRMWTPGVTAGMILMAHRLHERCWHVLVEKLDKTGGIDDLEVLLFDDELAPIEDHMTEVLAA